MDPEKLMEWVQEQWDAGVPREEIEAVIQSMPLTRFRTTTDVFEAAMGQSPVEFVQGEGLGKEPIEKIRERSKIAEVFLPPHLSSIRAGATIPGMTRKQTLKTTSPRPPRKSGSGGESPLPRVLFGADLFRNVGR